MGREGFAELPPTSRAGRIDANINSVDSKVIAKYQINTCMMTLILLLQFLFLLGLYFLTLLFLYFCKIMPVCTHISLHNGLMLQIICYYFCYFVILFYLSCTDISYILMYLVTLGFFLYIVVVYQTATTPKQIRFEV